MVPDLATHHGDKPAASISRICSKDRNDGLTKPELDLRILADLVAAVSDRAAPETPEYGANSVSPEVLDAIQLLPDRPPVALSYDVINTNRNIGTRLSGRIAEIHGDRGLAAGSIHITCRGSAGQSFGCFLVAGVKLELIGEANDYVGKGMASGEIVIRVSDDAKFEAALNTICGNTCLYGATGGSLFATGRAGERFAVRNSGSTAVVEGVGDHGCEYMTNGTVVILGKTGKNFGAGMSGGTAFVYDVDGKFFSRVNSEMVVALPVRRPQDFAEVRKLIELHLTKTGSKQAEKLLANWGETQRKLVRVIAKERAELEASRGTPRSRLNPGQREGGLNDGNSPNYPSSGISRPQGSCQGDGAEKGLRLVDGFHILVGGIGIGDDSGSGLDVGFAVLQQAGPERDAGIMRSVEAEITDRTRVGAALVFLHRVDDLHRPDLRGAADSSSGKGRAQHVVGAVRGIELTGDIGNDVHDVAVALDDHEVVHVHLAVLRDPADVVPC